MTKPNWVNVSPNSGNGNGSIQVIAQVNEGDARYGSVAVAGGDLSKTIEINQKGIDKSVICTNFRINIDGGNDIECNIDNDSFNPDLDSKISVNIFQSNIPLRGTINISFDSDKYAWNYGSIYFALGPGRISEALVDYSAEYLNSDGESIDFSNYNHEFMKTNLTIEYDLSKIDFNSGDYVGDFGISFNAADLNEYTLGWFVFPIDTYID